MLSVDSESWMPALLTKIENLLYIIMLAVSFCEFKTQLCHQVAWVNVDHVYVCNVFDVQLGRSVMIKLTPINW